MKPPLEKLSGRGGSDTQFRKVGGVLGGRGVKGSKEGVREMMRMNSARAPGLQQSGNWLRPCAHKAESDKCMQS